jgi:Bacterial regulatory proteins, gntR family
VVIAMKSAQQLALFAADTRFVLLVTSLFSSGMAAELGPTAVVVFLVLRSNANFTTGEVHIGQRLIAEQAGVTTLTARKALTALETRGLITRRQPTARARTIYTITDQIPVFRSDDDERKEKAGVLAVPFVPRNATDALNDARAALYRGIVPAGSPVSLTLNITVVNNTGTGDVIVNNAGSSHFHTGQLPPETVAWFSRMIAEATPPEGEGNK